MKPYDVDAARREVTEEARKAADNAQSRIADAALAAIAKLEVQTRTFESLPKDIGALYRDASNAIFAEIDPVTTFASGTVLPSKVQAQLDVRLAGYHVHSGQLTADIPSKKHRMIVFFIPID
jgi:hypothetical protein